MSAVNSLCAPVHKKAMKSILEFHCPLIFYIIKMKVVTNISSFLGLSSKMCKFIFFLTGSFQSCRFCMPESILFILKNACLHLVIHSQLVANQCPVGYRAAIPFFIQFHNPQVECLAYSSLIGECPFFCDFTKA